MGKQPLKAIELFCGIGGFRIACDNLGINTVWANDIDDKAGKIYSSNFGSNEFVQGDINELIDEIPDHDLLTGGFPCQPFSSAGKKKGIEDSRGTLFRVVVEVLKLKKPKYFVLENVRRLLSMQSGSHFATVINELSELDYSIEWRVIRASDLGLPQHRERIFIVGQQHSSTEPQIKLASPNELSSLLEKNYFSLSNSGRWKDIAVHEKRFSNWGLAIKGKFFDYNLETFEGKKELPKFSDLLQKSVSDKFDFTENTLERIKESTFVNRNFNGVQILYNQKGGARMGYTVFGVKGIAPTLTATASRHYERYKINGNYRRLTNVEYARLQGFSDDHCQEVSQYNQYSLFGNAVPPVMAEWVINSLISSENAQTIKPPRIRQMSLMEIINA